MQTVYSVQHNEVVLAMIESHHLFDVINKYIICFQRSRVRLPRGDSQDVDAKGVT